MKTNTSCPKSTKRGFKNLVRSIKAFLILLLFLNGAEFANAATNCDSLHDAPACNLVGPLVACLNGGLITITTTIDFSSGNPTLVYTLPINTTGADIVDTNFVSYSDSEYIETIILDPGTQKGQINLQLNVSITYPDGCVMTCECSKSITIIGVAATTSFPPIVCNGGSTTLTVTGSGASTYTYTLEPSGPTNSTGIFPGLTQGTYSVSVAGTKESIVCDTIVTANIPQPAPNPVVLNCPANDTISACQSQASINSAFATWDSLFTASGGTNPVNVNSKNQSPPNACGGSVSVYDSVYSTCQSPVGCSASFVVRSSPAVVFHCANDTTVASCQTQSAVNSEFAAWLATASGSGGCNGVFSNGSPTPPSACGGTTTVSFTYTSSCAPLTTTCTATFAVPSSPVVFHCANDTSVASCQTQTSVNNEFTAWLATANGSGGCNGNFSHSSASAPDACAGGTTTVTFTYTSTCAPLTSTCTATFSVPASPAVVFHCANDTAVASCQTQTSVNNEFTAWLATANGSGGCNGNFSHSSASAPDACAGGTTTVTFTYTSTCAPLTSTCTATFSVPAAPAVVFHCANDTTVASCQTQTSVNSEFTAWLATASGSGGCNGVFSNGSPSAPSACGGTTTVTFTYGSSCASISSCTKTFTVTASPTVVLHCANDTTVASCQTQTSVNNEFTAWLATANGSGGCNGNFSHSSASAPDACAGGTTTVTFTYTSTCAPLTSTCTATFSVPAAPAVVFHCANDTTVASCQTQTSVNSEFTAWLATASGSGGCNGVFSNGSPSAPSACGGTTTVTFTYSSSCASTSSCTKTFTVTASPTVVLHCANDTTVASCQTQTSVNNEFTAWLATANGSGGCNGNFSHSSASAPDACAGGTTTVTFTYTSTCAPLTSTCTATFSVPAAPAVVFHCANDTTVASCQTQTSVNNEFTAWLATANGSGGCNGNFSHNSASAPDACAGGTTTVTFTYTSTCAPLTTTCTVTFSVPASPTVVFHCANDTTVASCQTQASVNSEFAAWLATANGSGGCNGNFSHSTAVAPDACTGGTATVTFTYTSTCAPLTTTCTAHFTVPASPAVVFHCANDTTVASCQTQASVNSEFAAWLATANGSGGCNGNFSHSTAVAPDACTGGTATVTFTYTSTCAPLTTTCTAHFTVTASPAVVFHCANDTTIAASQTQAEINAAFAAWLLTASGSGGCNGNFSHSSGVAPIACSGGTTTITFTYTSTCAPLITTCTATFTVPGTPPPANCSNTGTINCTNPTQTVTVNSCDGAANRSYAWTGPNGFTSSIQCPSVTVGGTYTVVVTNTVGGCTTSCTTTVAFDKTPPPASCGSGTLSCTNPTQQISVNSCDGAANRSYSWTGPNGFTSTSQCSNVSVAGSYTVIVTNTSNGCTSSCTSTMGSNMTSPPASCGNTGTITCTNPTQQVTVNSCDGAANRTYSWTGPNGFTSSLQCPSVSDSGNYTVLVTNTTNGCTSTCSTHVNKNVNNPGVNISPVGPISLCEGSTEQICVSGADTYLWSTGATTSCITVGNILGPHLYTVTGTSNVNGCKGSSEISVTVNPPPTVNITPPQGSGALIFCQGGSVQLCASGALTYKWSPGSQTSTCITVSTAGTYTVVGTDGNSCTASTSVTVTVNPNPAVTVTPANANCKTDLVGSACANPSGGSGSYTYSWSSGATTSCINNVAPGSFTVTITDGNHCTASNSATVTIDTVKPVITLTAPTNLPICGSTGNTLTVSATGSNLTYSWTVNGVGWSITGGATSSTVTYTAGSGTTATFTVVVTNGTNGCSNTATVTFTCGLDLWGCTLGFWKNHVSIWDQTTSPISECVASAIASFGSGYSGDGTINSSYATTFGVTAAQMTAVGLSPSLTLLQALNLGGGGVFNMSRQGVAALLNGCGLSGHYKYTSAQVITLMHNAIVTQNVSTLGDQLDAINSAPPDNCPPAGKATKRFMNDAIAMDEDVMMSAYPNPFGDKTTIEVLPNIDFNNATVELFNINGQKVNTLYAGPVLANQTYLFIVDAANLPAGVYIYTFQAGDDAIFGKVVLIK